MSRVKRFERYPASYVELVRTAQDQTVIIECYSLRGAHRLRQDLYNFRTALRRHATEHHEDDWIISLCKQANDLQFSRRNTEVQVRRNGLDVATKVEMALRRFK